jgi:D-glycero-alpha-D-manno-heptose 1-phosphate guanylyltransferase
MKMLVLAGGFGTRLESVVAEVPKAMAPVGEVPFLYLQIQHWIDQGVRELIFLLHHKADQIINFLEAERSELLKDCKVDWLIEPKPMDTGGAVAYAVQQLRLKGDFLVTNADTWIGVGIHEVARAATPSMAVLSMNDTSRYGQVKFDDQFYITAFSEKNGDIEPGWINAGLCHLNVDLFKNWDGQPFSLERVCLSELARSSALKAVPLQTDFIDIGIPSDYSRFCRWIAEGRQESLCN